MMKTNSMNTLPVGLWLCTFLLIGCSSSETKHSPEWQLVYQNDFDGKAIYGSVDSLVSAMKHGQPVRVSWGGTEPDGSSWIEFAEPDFSTVMNDTAVVVQFPLSLIQTHYTNPDKSWLATNPPTGWRAMMSTAGRYHQFHYDFSTGKIVRIMYARTTMAWFTLSSANSAEYAQNLTPKNSFKVDSVWQSK
jgi:hypothetical protein